MTNSEDPLHKLRSVSPVRRAIPADHITTDCPTFPLSSSLRVTVNLPKEQSESDY